MIINIIRMPKVSIIIPVFNVGESLRRCLESVLGQTLQDIEAVVVDDCSTDDSFKIIGEFEKRDPRIKSVKHPVNRGAMWTRETGLENASGDYILFVDGNDAIRPEMCSVLLQKALMEDADLVACGYEYKRVDGSSSTWKQSLPHGSSSHDYLKALLNGDIKYNLCAKLYRKGIFDHFSHFHRAGYNHSQDEAVMFIISPHIKKAVCIDSPFYIHCQIIGSVPQKPVSANAINNIITTQGSRLESVRGYEDLQDDTRRFCARTLFNLIKNGGDRRVVRSAAVEHGLWSIVSFGSLRSLLVFRKAVTYWFVTHLNGFATLFFKDKRHAFWEKTCSSLAGFLCKKMGKFMSDSLLLRLRHLYFFGRPLRLNPPRSFNEKISWLMLHDREPEITGLVDKLKVKEIVSGLIGKEHVVPTIGVWDRADDIDFESLPDAFILKCTHDSGSAVICRDKSTFDFDNARKSLQKSLDTDFYMVSREWCYKNVPRRILAEPLLNPDGSHLDDWRFFCSGGEPKFVYVSTAGHINFISLDWQFLPFARTDHPPQGTLPEKPSRYEEMLDISRTLSKGHRFVRVDLYQVGQTVLLSELTVTPSAGAMPLASAEQDRALGDYIDLGDI